MLKILLRCLTFPLLLFSLAACTSKMVQGPFLNLPKIESELKKGVSTKMDVQRLLGAPQGFGGAIFPVTQENHDIWFYQNIVMDNIRSEQGRTVTDMDQKILLVFFTKNLFDGFLWYTGTIEGELKK